MRNDERLNSLPKAAHYLRGLSAFSFDRCITCSKGAEIVTVSRLTTRQYGYPRRVHAGHGRDSGAK
jgi:hypothetical protein